MSTVHGARRKATDTEIEELKAIALAEYAELALEEVPALVVQVRVQHWGQEPIGVKSRPKWSKIRGAEQAISSLPSL
jgi:hypothetical protein